MSTSQIAIKSANHRIYQCQEEKKIDLLKQLIQENSTLETLVVCSCDADILKESLKDMQVKIVEDKELVKDKTMKSELLISYDIPIKAIVYMARVSRASQKAFLLLAESEQKELHAIETLLGRVIKQEIVEGFGYPVKERAPEVKRKKLSKEEITEIAKQRHLDATVEKPTWEKKQKAPNKFLGKDENGKAMFSGKSGDRNHSYDGTPKARYNAPKKVGKTINIKARKPTEES